MVRTPSILITIFGNFQNIGFEAPATTYYKFGPSVHRPPKIREPTNFEELHRKTFAGKKKF